MDVGRNKKGESHSHKFYDIKRTRAISNTTFNRYYEAFALTIEAMQKKNITIYSCSDISRLNHIIPYKNLMDFSW